MIYCYTMALNGIVLGLILCALALRGAGQSNQSSVSTQITPRAAYHRITGILPLLPRDIQADVLLRVSEYTNAQERRKLALNAYELAREARWKFKREVVFGNMDSREGVESRIESLDVDSLSLRLRSLSSLAVVDPTKAMNLWVLLSFPRDDNRGCDSRLVKDSNALSNELEDLYKKVPAGQRSSFMYQAARKISDPADLLAFLDLSTAHPGVFMGSKAHFPPESFDLGDRSFMHLVDRITQRSAQLLAAIPTGNMQGIESAERLRAYLVANLQYPRCSEELDTERGKVPQWAVLHLALMAMPKGMDQLNLQFQRFGIRTISRRDIIPKGVRQAHQSSEAIWKAPASSRLLESLQYLSSEIPQSEQCHRAVDIAMQLPAMNRNCQQQGNDICAIEHALSFYTLSSKCADDSQAFHQIIRAFVENTVQQDESDSALCESLEAWVTVAALNTYHPHSVRDIEALISDRTIRRCPLLLAYCYLSELRMFGNIGRKHSNT